MSASPILVDYPVLVHGKYQGIVKYIGFIEKKKGEWAGVELFKELGKNNGTVDGRKYFTCRPNHGLFVRPENLKPYDPKLRAIVILQSFLRMIKGKRKVKYELNWRTWNALDSRNEQIQLEKGKKIKVDQGMPLIPSGVSKRRQSIKDAKINLDVEGVAIEDDYNGVRLPWPLTLDSVLKMLESFKEGKVLHYVYVNRIFEAIKQHYSSRSAVEEIFIPSDAKITVIGDIHGQLQDLFTILTINGIPTESNLYLFNGDVVDRGMMGVECLCVIFAFKLVLMDKVFINRGNHESRAQNSWMGYEEEVLEKYDGTPYGDTGRGRRLFELSSDMFDALPLASIIEKKVFVVHGGLARDHGITIEHIRNIKRKREPPIDKPGLENRLYEDLLWSDPRPTVNYPEPIKGFKVSDRGAGIEFGPDVTNGFCMTNAVALVIRSHECVQEGYEVLHGGRLITIFSASRYCGTQTNKGAFITFDKSMQPEIQQFYAHSIVNNTFVKALTEEERTKALEDDTVMMIVERICDHKPDLYYAFSTTDKAKKGLVSKIQWASALKSVLSLDIPFLSYAHRLVEVESDGLINYAKFIERFRIEMRPEDREWQLKIVENVCEKLFEICGNIEQAFEIFDVNSDGSIEYEEFANTLKKLDLGLSDLQIFELMRDIDVNHDSQIELSEFLERFQVSFTMLKQKVYTGGAEEAEKLDASLRKRANSILSIANDEHEWDDWTREALGRIGLTIYTQKLSLPQAFAKFDESESGWISYEEFAKGLVIFEPSFNTEEGLKLAKAVDGNNSGRINYMEFVNAFKIADKGSKRRPSIENGTSNNWQNSVIHQVSNVLYQHRIQLRSAFRMFDTNNDGKVTADEFQGGLKAINALLDHPLSEMQCEQLLKSLDKNGDGELDYKEFLEGFQIVDVAQTNFNTSSKHMLNLFKSRNLLSQATAKAGEALSKPCSIYLGFDPTADSLHVGHLVGLMALQHLQKNGHRPICLIGGATGMIGDPSGKNKERILLDDDVILRNTAGLRSDLERLLHFDSNDSGAKLVNNLEWYKNMGAIHFVREVGKHFRINTMLTRDSVKSRLESDSGISYTEFSYQLFQAYDFLHLNKEFDCTFQLGGSDQWGNIISGIDLIRKATGTEVHGVTVPLLTTSTGEKFGKSAGNAIWLNENKTSDFEFYQYFWRTEDSDIAKLLKTFTNIDVNDIENIANQISKGDMNILNEAKEMLASTITKVVRGENGVVNAKKASQVLYGGSIEGLDAITLQAICQNVPRTDFKNAEVLDNIVNIAVKSGAVVSKAEAKRLINSGGLYVNNRRISNVDEKIKNEDLVGGRVCLLRTGKKNYRLLNVV